MKKLILLTGITLLTLFSNNSYSQKRDSENSDYVKIGNKIKHQFEKWATKGEFEKTSDHKDRISNESSKQFANICFNEINKKTSLYSKINKNSDNKWLNIKLKKYDADQELYYISLSKENGSGTELMGNLKISPKEAKELKENFHYYNQIIGVKDWFFSNNNLLPSKVILSKSKVYVVDFNLNNKKDIIYSTSALNINITNLPNIPPFNYKLQVPSFIEKTNQKKIEEEDNFVNIENPPSYLGRIEEENNTVYSFVSMENPPSYPGGIEKFYKFLNDNIKYPPMAAENNIQGNVFVSFTVEKDGSLSDIKIDRKLGYGTDEEAIRVLKLSRRWNPGMQNGKPVRVKYNIPIRFSPPQ